MKKGFDLARLNVLILVSLVIITLSCNIEKDSPMPLDETIDTVNFSENSANPDKILEQFARSFAKSLGETALRSLIKEEALKMFDGDYDILVKDFINKPFKGSTYIKRYLLENLSTDVENGRTSDFDAEAWFNALIEKYPNLQISVPVNIEKWDTENFIPPVTFLTDDFDESSHLEILAINSDGSEFMISTVDEPEYPVVVISRSERVDEYGNLSKDAVEVYSVTLNNSEGQQSNIFTSVNAIPSTPSGLSVVHGSANNLILSWNDVAGETGYQIYRSTGGSFSFHASTALNDNSYVSTGTTGQKYFYQVRAVNTEGNSAWSNIVSTFASSRNDGESLKMKRMRFTESALKNVESWTAGAPEIRIRIAVGSPTSAVVVYTSGKLEPRKRNDIKDTWWNKEVSMLNSWNMSYHGSVLTINFREEDALAEADWSFDVNYEDKNNNSTIKYSGKISYTDDKGDEGIASENIFWWQPKDMVYSQNGFSWQFVY